MSTLAIEHGSTGTRLAWYDADTSSVSLELCGPVDRTLPLVIQRAESRLHNVPFVDAVLVVPHFQRQAADDLDFGPLMDSGALQLGERSLPLRHESISRSIAAAAYACWTQRESPARFRMDGRTILVVDMGSKLFEASVVRVDSQSMSVEWVDGIRGPEAGYRADLLLCAEVCSRCAVALNEGLPGSADELAVAVQDASTGFLSKWLSQCSGLKESFSLHARFLRGNDWSRLRPPRKLFEVPGRRPVEFVLDLPTYQACFGPLLLDVRQRMIGLLERQSRDDPPVMVVCTGASCGLHGFREEVLESSLRAVFDDLSSEAIARQIFLPTDRYCRPDALGAAIIASGAWLPQERLAHDLAVCGTLSPGLAKALESSSNAVLLTPIIPRGTNLPATVTSDELGLLASISPGKHLDIEVVIDACFGPRWSQTWRVRHPGGSQQQSVRWSLTAKLDGTLELRVETLDGRSMRVVGQFIPRATVEQSPSQSAILESMHRISPQVLREVIEVHGTGVGGFEAKEDRR